MKKFLILFVLIAASLYAEPYKVYMIGNSLTDEVKYDDWIKLCASASSETLYARKMIPGAPISWHQEHPAQGFSTKSYGYPEKAFKEYPWDALTLQPFTSADREIPAAIHYANLMWQYQPDCKVYIYAQWPNRDSDDWLGRWETFKDQRYTAVYDALCKETGKTNRIFMIPAGWAFCRLEKKMQLGAVSGYQSIWQLYSDGVHVSNVGSYIVGLSFYATIFGKSPIGMPVGNYQGKADTVADRFEISPELARIIQETVWEAVTAHLASGVRTDTPVAITLPGLIPAVEKEPYRFEIDAAFGTPPYSWSVAKGLLPGGVQLSPNGLIEGTPSSQGEFAFTAQVTDAGGKTATRDFTLHTGPDSAPKITTKQLPDFQQGQFIQTRLEATGGNGVLNWNIAEGKLPGGLVLLKNGLLSGSPATTNSYNVKLKVQDSDGAHPESDTVTFTGTITPANLSSVLLVRKASGKITVDGRLDPAEGWDFKQELKKPFFGKPKNTVRFDAQWFAGYLYIAVEVVDSEVVDGKGNYFANDAVVFYFDGLNNREATYNFDDRRLVFGPSDKPGQNGDRKKSIGMSINTQAKYTPTATGYIMEAGFKLADLGVPSQSAGRTFDAANAVIGFDLVNHDVTKPGREQTRLGWQGTDENPENPGRFGTLILVP
jgi:hypothetical protein